MMVSFHICFQHYREAMYLKYILDTVIPTPHAKLAQTAAFVTPLQYKLTLDFLKGNIIKKMSERKQVVTMQILVVFFIVLSVVLAINRCDQAYHRNYNKSCDHCNRTCINWGSNVFKE